MYQGGMVAKQEAEKRADAQMLGEKDVDLPAAEEQSKVTLLNISFITLRQNEKHYISV